MKTFRHYTPLQVSYYEDIEIDNRKLIIHQNKKKPFGKIIVNILAEEIGYNVHNKEYKMILIEKPLFSTTSISKPLIGTILAPLSPTNSSSTITRHSLKSLKPSKPLRGHDDCSKYLEFISQKVTTDLEMEVKRLQSNYMILYKYLDDAAKRIKNLTENYTPKYELIIEGKSNLICDSIRQSILLSVENYVIYLLHGKLMASIYNKHENDDKILMKKFNEIQKSKLNICQLGAQTAFEDFILEEEILNHIRRLSSLQSPLAIVSNLVKLFELISEGLNQSVRFKNLIADCDGENDVVSICSDDLIATLVYSMAQAKPTNLYSLCKYLDTFGWSSSSKDQAAYYTATFQIVIHYVFNYNSFSNNQKKQFEKQPDIVDETSNKSLQIISSTAFNESTATIVGNHCKTTRQVKRSSPGKIPYPVSPQFVDSIESCGSTATTTTDSAVSLFSTTEFIRGEWEVV